MNGSHIPWPTGLENMPRVLHKSESEAGANRLHRRYDPLKDSPDDDRTTSSLMVSGSRARTSEGGGCLFTAKGVFASSSSPCFVVIYWRFRRPSSDPVWSVGWSGWK